MRTVREVRRTFTWIVALYRSWCSHRGGALAAELLLFSLLSLLPLLLSLAAALGLLDRIVGLDRAERIESAVRDEVVDGLGTSPQVLDLVDQAFTGGSGTVATVGVVFALYAASRGFISLVGSLDVVFATATSRGWVAQRVVGVALSLGSMLLFPAALTAGYAGRAIAGEIVDDERYRQLADWGIGAAGIVTAVCWVTTVYHLAPKERGRWSDHLVGAAVCVGGTVAVTEVFRLWLDAFGMNPLYGAIGATLGLLWWAYFVCCTFFVGAEVTVLRRARTGHPHTTG